MSTNPGLRLLIWNEMMNAEMNWRYYGYIGTRYRSWDKGANIAIAVTSSTSVAAWKIWGEPGLDWIWPTLTGLTVVIALVKSIVDPAASLRLAARLRGAWFSITKEFDLLWAELPGLTDEQARDRFRKFMDLQKGFAEDEALLKKDTDLILKCQDEVEMSRGVPVWTGKEITNAGETQAAETRAETDTRAEAETGTISRGQRAHPKDRA